MTDHANELQDLRLAWAALERRLARQEALLIDGQRQRRLDAVRASLSPLRWGQTLQIPFGIVVMLLAIASWRSRWDIVNVRVAAFVMQAYGIALIAAGAQTLTLLGRVDYGAPVVEIQRRLAEVQRWYEWTSLTFGMAWWLLWVPALMILGGARGVDIAARGPWVLGGYAAACGVGLLVSLWLVWRDRRDGRSTTRVLSLVSTASRRLRRAEATLDEIRRFEAES